MGRQASQQVLDLLEPVVSGLGYEFVGAEYLAQGRHSLLRIYIDNPETGVTVDDCEKVSRQVSSMLDVEDPISGQYTLEVSSPGLDRPLFTGAQYSRFVGHRIKLRLARMIEGRRKMTALLKACEDDVITVAVEDETMQIALDDIDQARLVPEFD